MNYIEIKEPEAKKIIIDGGCVYAIRNFRNYMNHENHERFIVKIYELDRLELYTHSGYIICKDKDDI